MNPEPGATEQARTLSSAQTFVVKAIFPAIWIAGFGAATLSLWFEDASDSARPDTLIAARWISLVVWLVFSAVVLRIGAILKRVRVDGKFLYVSNYRREVAVPLSAVDTVTENRWINIHPVTIRFRAPTAFGQTVTFMPKSRVLGWRPHPVVAELRSAADLARVT